MNPSDYIIPDYISYATKKPQPEEVEFTLKGLEPLVSLHKEMFITHPDFGTKKFEVIAVTSDTDKMQTRVRAKRILDKKS